MVDGGRDYMLIVNAIKAVHGIDVFFEHRYEQSVARSPAFRAAWEPFAELLAETELAQGN